MTDAPSTSRWIDQALTPRQLQVALLAREGLRQAEIASALHISPAQVARHLAHARARLGARTTPHLIAILVATQTSHHFYAWRARDRAK